MILSQKLSFCAAEEICSGCFTRRLLLARSRLPSCHSLCRGAKVRSYNPCLLVFIDDMTSWSISAQSGLSCRARSKPLCTGEVRALVDASQKAKQSAKTKHTKTRLRSNDALLGFVCSEVHTFAAKQPSNQTFVRLSEEEIVAKALWQLAASRLTSKAICAIVAPTKATTKRVSWSSPAGRGGQRLQAPLG
jgi:hypothetical protein